MPHGGLNPVIPNLFDLIPRGRSSFSNASPSLLSLRLCTTPTNRVRPSLRLRHSISWHSTLQQSFRRYSSCLPAPATLVALLPSLSSTIQAGTKRSSEAYYFMGSEEVKDPLKEMDWKNIGGDVHKQSSGAPVTKKRLPKKIRQIPECYFLPRRSLPSAALFYGSFIAAGIGAGMLLEVWINKKVQEDGGVIWEFDK
ncbi:Dihydrosphingosine phosphate lyase [Ancistrocladus abbreviatus]